MNLDNKIYDLSEKLSVTQGQVNTLFSLLEEVKKAITSMASDIRSIREEVHKFTPLTTTIEDINGVKDEIKELRGWKDKMLGAMIIISLLMPFAQSLVSIYMK